MNINNTSLTGNQNGVTGPASGWHATDITLKLSNTSDVQDRPNAGKASDTLDMDRLKRAVDELNQHLAGMQTQVVFDPQSPPNELWLNVVDKQSGQVIQKFPPEGLRKFAESRQITGLTVDLQF
ncbi:flagellar protein FlaG [Alicyclobacillus contaminans]|uniref:flagellar protein FlaG n=1 Tax=Alicyclobacillus contaminans TaxID=392016 RepID=UPI00054EAA65|nr:flagellar protein FlaG [Alicyclobacillus contaminans]